MDWPAAGQVGAAPPREAQRVRLFMTQPPKSQV
jgi:hypothetical protein